MRLTCINNPVKPDRLDKDDWTREKCEGNLSTSLLEGSKGSEAALSDCENRAKREIENRLFGNGMVVLGLATSHCRKLT